MVACDQEVVDVGHRNRNDMALLVPLEPKACLCQDFLPVALGHHRLDSLPPLPRCVGEPMHRLEQPHALVVLQAELLLELLDGLAEDTVVLLVSLQECLLDVSFLDLIPKRCCQAEEPLPSSPAACRTGGVQGSQSGVREPLNDEAGLDLTGLCLRRHDPAHTHEAGG